MPEGPTIILLLEQICQFDGKEIKAVSGNSKIDQSRLLQQKVIEFKSWGKHFLIVFKEFTLKVHFLMFGSYTVNERKDREARLRLEYSNGERSLFSR